MVAPDVLSDKATICPAEVWLYEPGTGQKVGVAAGGGGGGVATVDVLEDGPPPQLVAKSSRTKARNQSCIALSPEVPKRHPCISHARFPCGKLNPLKIHINIVTNATRFYSTHNNSKKIT